MGSWVGYQCVTKVESELQKASGAILDLAGRNRIAQVPRGGSEAPRESCAELQEICSALCGHMVLGLLGKSSIMKVPQHCATVESELWKVCHRIIGLMDRNPTAGALTEEYNTLKLQATAFVRGGQPRV